MKVLNRIDVAVIVCDYNKNELDDYEKLGRHSNVDAILGNCEKEIINKLNELKIPYLIIVNKCDLNKNYNFHENINNERKLTAGWVYQPNNETKKITIQIYKPSSLLQSTMNNLFSNSKKHWLSFCRKIL